MFKIILFIGLLLVVPNFTAKSESPELFISEISFAGSTLESNCQKLINGATIEGNTVGCGLDKWIEIANNSAKDIDLQNYKIRLSYKDILIKDSWVIPSQSVGILGTKNKNMASSVDSLGLNVYKIGLLQGISSKEKSSLSVGLVSPENLVLDSAILPVEFGKEKKSLEKVNGSWKLSETQFLPNNYGTPGVFNFAIPVKTSVVKEEILPVVTAQVEPVVSIKIEPILEPKLEVAPEVKSILSLEPILEPKIKQVVVSAKTNSKVKNISMVEVKKPQIIMPKEIKYQAEKNTLVQKNIEKTPVFKEVSIQNYSNSTLVAQKEVLGFSHTSFEQVLAFGFLGMISILQKIITKITKKCKALFSYKLANK